MRFLHWIVGLPVAVVAVVFALSNRTRIGFKLWPFPYEAEAPLFVAVFAGLAIGFLIGALAAWAAGRRWRRLARARAQEVERLGRELAAAERDGRERLAPPPGAPSP